MIRWFFAGLFVILTVLLALGRSDLKYPFFSRAYSFSSVNGVQFGPDNTILAIDNGNTALLEVSPAGKLVRKIDGGDMSSAFFYASYVCQDNRGNTYICDIIYGEHGNRLEAERIIRLNGSDREEMLVMDYSQDEDPPLQYGNIKELRIFNDTLYYVYDSGSSLDVYFLADNGWELRHSYPYPDSIRVNAASFDAEASIMLIAGKDGHLYTCTDADAEPVRLPDFERGQIPMSVTTGGGKAYIADVSNSSIYIWDESDASQAPELFCAFETTPFRLAVSEDAEELIFSDQEFYYSVPLNADSDPNVVESAPYSRWGGILLVRIGAVIWSLSVLALLVWLFVIIARAINSSPDKQQFARMIMVAGPALLIAAFVAYSVISITTEDKKAKQIDELHLFAQILSSQVDMDSLAEIRETEDYGTDAFWDVKNPLDRMVDKAYDIEDYYYYILLRPNEPAGYLELIMDYENAYPLRMMAYPWEDNEYVQAVTTGEEVLIEGGTSSYGSWTYTLVPLRGASGEVEALLEVGMNFDQLRASLGASVKEIILGAAAGAIVVTMFVMELLFLLGYREKKLLGDPIVDGITVPLRFILFIAFMTDCMQDGFIAIMCSELYQAEPGGWFHALPGGIAVALPMSAQLFAAAIASLIGGRLAQRRGPKPIMVIGFSLGAAGFLICAAGMGYSGVLLGKSIFGFGQGLIYVAANALSAFGNNQEARAQGYADIAAGVLSGVTVGVGLGSLVLSIGNYQTVYIVGVCCLLIGLVLTLMSRNVRSAAVETEDRQSAGIPATVKFLSSRRVWPFLLMMLTPFMIALSLRDYLFPLYANEVGLSEVRIGQVCLLFGMAVLYIGPPLAKLFISKLGAKYSVVAANITMVLAVAAFAVYPCLTTILIGVGLLYVATSFAYACQYYYFEELDETAAFGVGDAFGLYSMFENIGQTIGPVVFAGIMLLGYTFGSAVISVALLLLVMLFILIANVKKGK